MIVQRTKTYAVCPACEADAGCIDHLLGTTTKTWWYCDSCGQRYQLMFHADGTVDITIAAGRTVTTVDLLMLPPQEKPVYFIVEGMRFEDESWQRGDMSETDHKHFHYESHSCPTNWLKPQMVYFDGDSDPHGLIEFVATKDDTDFPPEENHGPNDRDFAMIAMIEREIEKQV